MCVQVAARKNRCDGQRTTLSPQSCLNGVIIMMILFYQSAREL